MDYNLDIDLLVFRNMNAEIASQDFNVNLFQECLSWFRKTQGEFDTNRFRINRALSYSSQTLLLEDLLNVTFNNGQLGIYIVNDALNFSRSFIFNREEGEEPKYVFNREEGQTPTYLVNNTEIQLERDFIVYVPLSVFNVQTNEVKLNELKALVNKYKLSGKRFIVLNYE